MPSFLLKFTTVAAALQSVVGVSLRSNGAAGKVDEETGRHLQETLYCNSIGCPGGFIPIPEASTTECTGDCSTEQCCEAFCSFWACPDGYIQVEDAGMVQCDSNCSTELCCVSGNTAGTGGVVPGVPGEDVLLCNSIGCPGGFIPIPEAAVTVCDGDTCTSGQCCEAFCSFWPCPANYIPVEDAGMIQCDSDCSTEQCCVSGNTAGIGGVVPGVPGEDVLLCNSIGCPGGFIPIPEAAVTVCDGDTCTSGQCCEAFCSFWPCPANYIPVEDAGMIQCDSDCSTEQCCVFNG